STASIQTFTTERRLAPQEMSDEIEEILDHMCPGSGDRLRRCGTRQSDRSPARLRLRLSSLRRMRSRVVSIALIAVGIAVLPIVAAAKCPSSSPTGSFLLPRYGVGVRTLTIEDATRTTPAAGTFPETPMRTPRVE